MKRKRANFPKSLTEVYLLYKKYIIRKNLMDELKIFDYLLCLPGKMSEYQEIAEKR